MSSNFIKLLSSLEVIFFIIISIFLLIFEIWSNPFIILSFYFLFTFALFYKFRNQFIPQIVISITVLLYTIPSLIIYLSSSIDLSFASAENLEIFSAKLNFIDSYKYIGYFLLGILLTKSTLKSNNVLLIKKYRYKISYLKLLFVIGFAILFILWGFSKVDFYSIKDTYSITEGYSLIMGGVYIVNFLILFLLIDNFENKRNNYLLISLLLPINFLLFYLGTRQVFFVLILSLFLYLFSTNRLKLNFKFISIFILLYFIFSSITIYRDFKSIQMVFSNFNFISAGIISFFYETNLTFFNLLKVIDFNYSYNIVPIYSQLNQLIFQFIPSFFIDNKDQYMIINSLSKDYNLAPYGTFFIVGELALIYKSKVLIFLYGFFYSRILNSFYTSASYGNSLNKAFYFYAIVILYFLSVRGMIVPSLKIVFTIIYPVYMIFKVNLFKYDKV